jgi:hypothetical protein
MKIKSLSAIILATIGFAVNAQEKKADTVIVSLAKTSKVIFTIEDRKDLEILKHYNFQELFRDILNRIEKDSLHRDNSDTTNRVATNTDESWSSPPTENPAEHDDRSENEYTNSNESNNWHESNRGRIGRTWQSTNIDFGINNYLAKGQFPDTDNKPYAVRPWGSWYIAGNSVQRTRVGKNVFMEWGVGVSWYNFKFQRDDIVMTKTDTEVLFTHDVRDVNHIKSKLRATYINVSLIPMLDFGDHSRKPRMWDNHGSAFRIGIGPYAGYKISSKSKLVYEEKGNRERDKERDNFYLNNLRYGLRLQLGFNSTDFFFNYDLNELFVENKGPKLNAVSFGFIF